jgi:DNA-binding HxlR family transcriptional regulator
MNRSTAALTSWCHSTKIWWLPGVTTKFSTKQRFCRLKLNRIFAMNMGVTKSFEFTAQENRLAKYAKALGHPARVAILKLLAKKQSCVCGDIVDELPLSQSTVSQHLKELKEAGLIQGEIDGAKVCYCIDPKEWKSAQVWLNQLFDSYKGDSNCC